MKRERRMQMAQEIYRMLCMHATERSWNGEPGETQKRYVEVADWIADRFEPKAGQELRRMLAETFDEDIAAPVAEWIFDHAAVVSKLIKEQT